MGTPGHGADRGHGFPGPLEHRHVAPCASRHARENRDPLGYLADSYYERWLYGLEVLLEQNGLVTRDEIAARMAELAEGDA
jgi:hypothetical protein